MNVIKEFALTYKAIYNHCTTIEAVIFILLTILVLAFWTAYFVLLYRMTKKLVYNN